jgi:hypothetical protein
LTVYYPAVCNRLPSIGESNRHLRTLQTPYTTSEPKECALLFGLFRLALTPKTCRFPEGTDALAQPGGLQPVPRGALPD